MHELRIRGRIVDSILSIPGDEMYDQVLQFVLEALESKYGVFGYVDEFGTLVCPSLTTDVWYQCEMSNRTMLFPPERWNGIWGRALKERKTHFSNDGVAVPEGHIPITRSLATPILIRNQVLGLLHVANKPTDYTTNDQHLLERIARQIAPILQARLEWARRQQELRDYQERLEGIHEERVAEQRSAIKALVAEIDQRKSTERALRQSEERFAKAFQNMPIPVSLTRVGSGEVLEVNDALLDLVGRSRDEVIGKTGLELGAWRDEVERERVLNVLLNEGRLTDFEMRATRKNGEIRQVIASAVRIDLSGEACMLAMLQDVTEHRFNEQALRQSEDRFRQVLEAASDIICEVDLRTRVCEYVSPAILRLTGFSQEEFTALGFRGYSRRVHPEDWTGYKRRLAELLSRSDAGASTSQEYRWRCRDGLYRWFADTISLVRDEYGAPVTLVFTSRDITERRRAEESLHRSEERFRSLSACAPVGIFLADADDKLVYSNDRLREISGVAEEQDMGDEWTKVIHPDDLQAVLDRRSRAIAEKREYVGEHRLITPEGNLRWVRMRSRPVSSTAGEHIGRVGIIEDITEHMEAVEKERRLHNQEARTRELRAAVTALERMAATLGHELRNPLGVISNSAYFLANHAGLSDPKALKHAETIAREVQSAKRVIDDILEFAHVPQILPSPASLNVIISQAIERSRVPANIRLALRLAPDLPLLVCDAERLERAFLDIIANAVQAMPHGGRLCVKTRLSADAVTVTFSDTGEGIAAENLARVFDPMFTTKLRGIGLGLTVVHRTIEQHQGAVELRSTLGGGTSVIITLPIPSAGSTLKDGVRVSSADVEGSESALR